MHMWAARVSRSKTQQIKKLKDDLDALKSQKKAQQGSYQRCRAPPQWDVAIRSAPSSMHASCAEGRIASSTGTLVPNDWQTMSVRSTAGPLVWSYVNRLCEPLRQAQSIAGSKANVAFQKEEVDSSHPPPQFCPSPRALSGAGLMHPHPAHSSLSQERNVHRITPAQCGTHFVFFGAKQVGSQPLLAAAGFSAPRGCQARFVPNAFLYVFDAFGKCQEQDWVQFIETAQQRYMLGSHWTVLAWQDSPVWTATYFGNLLLSAHHKVAFDSRSFGHANRKRGCLVSSSNVFRRMRWSCCRHHWPHAHFGKQAITQHLLPAFVDVFTAAVASLASSRFLVTRVACAGEPGFPCHIAASEFLHQPGKYKKGIIRCDNQKQEEQVKKQLPTQLPLLGPLVRPVASTVEIHVAATLLPIPDFTPHFPQYHSRTAAERKRPLGAPISAQPSRSLVTSQWAATAGTQVRRTAPLPLLRTEVEPGEAIRHLTHQVHPFREYPKLEADLSRAVRFAARPVKAIRRKRLAMFGLRRDRAVALLPQSVEMLASTPDAQLRNYFFRDVPPGREQIKRSAPHCKPLARVPVAWSKSSRV